MWQCVRHSPCAAVRQPDVRIQVHAAVPDADRGGLQRREKKKERKQIRGMAAKSLDVSNWTAQLLDGAQAKSLLTVLVYPRAPCPHASRDQSDSWRSQQILRDGGKRGRRETAKSHGRARHGMDKACARVRMIPGWESPPTDN